VAKTIFNALASLLSSILFVRTKPSFSAHAYVVSAFCLCKNKKPLLLQACRCTLSTQQMYMRHKPFCGDLAFDKGR